MKYFKITKKVLVLASVSLLAGIIQPAVASAATSPTLGALGSYSVLGHTTVTNTGATTMPGDLGISIGGSPVGFPPGTVGPPGTVRNAADSLAAQTDNTAAFGYIDQGCDTTYSGVKDLAASNLVAGVYCAGAFELSGTLTLSGTGVWIFKSASTLITSGTANVVGGNSCNVWWRQVSSAVLGTNTAMTGNIMSSTASTMQSGASLNGRITAQTAAVSLSNNTITDSGCLTAPVFTSTTSTGTTPGLPNTGLNTRSSNTQTVSIAVALVAAGLISFYIVRKRQAV